MTESGSNLEDALQKTKAYLRHLELTGDTFLPKNKPAPLPVPSAEGKNPLISLGNEVIICIKCDVLAKSRKSVVFGAGNPRAEQNPGYKVLEFVFCEQNQKQERRRVMPRGKCYQTKATPVVFTDHRHRSAVGGRATGPCKGCGAPREWGRCHVCSKKQSSKAA